MHLCSNSHKRRADRELVRILASWRRQMAAGGCEDAATAILSWLREELQKKPERSAEEEWTLQNLLLVFKSDEELKQHLRSNRMQL
jgi:hypothetical protein